MKRSYVVALTITLVAVVWMASGQFGGVVAQDAAPTEAPQQVRELVSVRVAVLGAEPLTSEVVVNGRSQAFRSVSIKAEVRGRVEAILAERGAAVAAAAPLVRIAVDARRADLEEARARVALRKTEWDAARRLADQGFSSEIRRAETKAAYEAALAAVKAAELALEKTEIKAPFEGIVDSRPVELGDFVDVGDPIATIVDLDPIKFVAYVGERHVRDLSLGGMAHARTLSGDEVEGRITFIAAAADPDARTFRVEVEAPNPGRAIVDGLTSSLRLPVAQRTAHRLSPAVLTLDDAGTIGVKTVDADDIVRFVPVRILSSDPAGIWVGGLPDTATVVIVGQEFVVDGQKVKPVSQPGGVS
ncbi:efflux RND transporter periplasmic adaptor subunit [Rhodocista pekingensis]|uniref:Efflux RND transporter periplasmic adaptor subunit n=1 Tax=Rhodocista pekingensis TaxID=201185 RepID=A0ABW2KSS1_9PROT